ncbi:MAG: hypothetical protein JNJ61_14975 [Anaerolineae bacterium]|nr:hypothetical protein [Anaerolineae bacterium]
MKPSRVLWGLLGLVTLVFGLAAVALFIALLNGADNLPALATTLYIYAAFLSLIIVPSLIIWLISRVFSALRGRLQRVGEVTLYSILAAVIFFPSSLTSVFERATLALLGIFSLPQDMFGAWRAQIDECGVGTELASCISNMSLRFVDVWADAAANAVSTLFANRTLGLSSTAGMVTDVPATSLPVDRVVRTVSSQAYFPFRDMLVAIAIGVIVALIVRFVRNQRSTDLSQSNGAATATHISPLLEQASYLVLILVGLYLVIVSMIAIPALEASVPSVAAVSPEELSVQIETLRDEVPSAVSYDPQTTNPFAALEEYLKQNPNLLNKSELWTWRNLQNGQRDNLITAHNSYAAALHGARNTEANRVIVAYRTNTLGRIGEREMIEYFETLVTLYRDEISQLESLQAECSTAFQQADRYWSQISVDAVEGNVDMLNQESLPMENVVSRSCQTEFIPVMEIPDRAVLGSYWGVFGDISGWLLITESMSLALLVGMLGTGLLGAAVSPFILPDQPQTSKPELFVQVIIRGVVATFVIFFIAQAGLIVLGAETNQTNGYILLLVCLLGAMFSELPLRSAKIWFTKRLAALEGEESDKDSQSGDSAAKNPT